MINKDSFIELSLQLYPELSKIREHLHANPELSFEEFNTSEFIKSKLDEWDVAYTEGWLKTGIVAEYNLPQAAAITFR